VVNRQYAMAIVSLDQIRTVDKRRIIRKVGHARPTVVAKIKRVIQEMLMD
jgi:mRNA-degrading endonuclease toxin of MazEF toxin-antitoxin module